uniref:Nascent polypeptide-associated complex protein n=2 Tax=Caldiarchaeum subterraneum TaxID=311458 RepID=E6N4E0_CALS0|nr:nascent polypeptide-associated complex subunit alpha [Candidatus Caldarchaeum subterraneum]
MKRLSPREMRRAQERMLKNLGLNVEEMGQAEEVVIKLGERVITLRGPLVYAVKTGGEKIFQIIGGEEVAAQVVETKPVYEPSEEDVSLVMAQTGASEEEAKKALLDSGGDLAKAILMIRSRR